MRIKICGITRVEDARLAEKLGADFIGLVFARSSRRRVDVATARGIVRELAGASAVGVFVEQKLNEVEAIAREVGLRAVQLYRKPSRRPQGVLHIQAVRVRDRRSLAALRSPLPAFFLLDAWHDSAMGGTGRSFDWSILPEDLSRVILSGGITPANVRAALALSPYGIDVASGVESSPGIKDSRKMKALFQEVLR